jgi:Holliday junction resolvasome RuvABC endonuclease subunit
MIILSVDIGRTMGVVVSADGEFSHSEEYQFETYYKFDWRLKDLVTTFKPDLILIPYPTRFYSTIIAHAKLMGIVCLVAEKRGITVVEVNDGMCKKSVVGSGRATKKEIMAYFKEESEHIADSKMFVEWYLNSVG